MQSSTPIGMGCLAEFFPNAGSTLGLCNGIGKGYGRWMLVEAV